MGKNKGRQFNASKRDALATSACLSNQGAQGARVQADQAEGVEGIARDLRGQEVFREAALGWQDGEIARGLEHGEPLKPIAERIGLPMVAEIQEE